MRKISLLVLFFFILSSFSVYGAVSTDVIYEGSEIETWTLTIPGRLPVGRKAEIKLTAEIPFEKELKLSSDNSIRLTKGDKQEILTVKFEPFKLKGNDFEVVNSSGVVEIIKKGKVDSTWLGSFMFRLEPVKVVGQ